MRLILIINLDRLLADILVILLVLNFFFRFLPLWLTIVFGWCAIMRLLVGFFRVIKGDDDDDDDDDDYNE